MVPARLRDRFRWNDSYKCPRKSRESLYKTVIGIPDPYIHACLFLHIKLKMEKNHDVLNETRNLNNIHPEFKELKTCSY